MIYQQSQTVVTTEGCQSKQDVVDKANVIIGTLWEQYQAKCVLKDKKHAELLVVIEALAAMWGVDLEGTYDYDLSRTVYKKIENPTELTNVLSHIHKMLSKP